MGNSRVGKESRRKKAGPGPVAANYAKERHNRSRRAIDWTAPPAPGLVARPDKPQVNSKYKSYLEFIENPEKKKKLEVSVSRGHHRARPAAFGIPTFPTDPV